MITRGIIACALSLTLAGFSAGDAAALSRASAFTIRNDHGGYVVDYAISMLKLQQSRRPVKFAGRCDSACTIYLGLSRAQTCITPSAKFGFHLPFGSSARGNRVAVRFLMKKYPRWVVEWLEANGGLSSRLKVMPYDYASRFIRSCDSAES
jgi:hypothetical protein